MASATSGKNGQAARPASSFLGFAIGNPGNGFQLGSARILGLALVGAAAMMLLIRSMLYVRTGWGIEDFVGWSDDSASGPTGALLELWHYCQLIWLARTYFALDSILFVPIYAAFFLKTGWVLANALDKDTGKESKESEESVVGRRWFAIFWVPVLMLVAIDLLENLVGLDRTKGWGPGIGVGTLALGVIGVWLLAGLRVWKISAYPLALAIGTVALSGLMTFKYLSAACAAVEGATWPGRLGCAAHHSKFLLIGVVLLVLVDAIPQAQRQLPAGAPFDGQCLRDVCARAWHAST